MFGTRSRVLAAARLAAEREGAGPASRIKIQPNLIVLVPGPRPEQKKQKAPAVTKPQPREHPPISNPRPTTQRELILEWLESLPASLQRGDSQTPSRPSSAIDGTQSTFFREYIFIDMESDEPSAVGNKTTQALTRRPGYRNTLRNNGIEIIPSDQALPDHVTQLLKRILPEEPLQVSEQDQDELHQWRNLAIEGATEGEVEQALHSHMLSKVRSLRFAKTLLNGKNRLLSRLRVPNKDPSDRLSTPKPDYYLGYRPVTFPASYIRVLRYLDESDVMYPFLDIESKGDGSNSYGGLWVATNQCLGGTATFLNTLARLKAELAHRGLATLSEALDPIVFSVVTNGTEARLFGSFSDEEGSFSMFLIRGFLLYEDQGFEKLDEYLTKIIEWGAGTRLSNIKNALEALVGSSRPAEDPQITSGGPDIEGEKEEGSIVQALQAANIVTVQPPSNANGGQPVNDQPVQISRPRSLTTKRSQEQVGGEAGRPRKKPRSA